MGKGDKKTRRGKITIGSYGKTRPGKKKKTSSDNVEAASVGNANKSKKG